MGRLARQAKVLVGLFHHTPSNSIQMRSEVEGVLTDYNPYQADET